MLSQKGKKPKQTCLGSSLHIKRLHTLLTGTTAEIIKGGMDKATRDIDGL